MTRGPSPYAVATAARLRLSVGQSAVLKAIAGELLTRAELVAFRTLTKAPAGKPRSGGYAEVWARAGRRSGKSLHLGGPFIVSALLGDYDAILSAGERGRVLCVAPTLGHLKQLFDGVVGILDALGIECDRREGEIEPRGRRTLVQGVVADYLGPRSGTAVAAVVDEAALLPSNEGADGYDVEIFAALKPAMATTGGKLLVLSSPWSRSGVHFDTIEKTIGKTDGRVLAVDAPTWVWHPALTEQRTRELEPNPLRWRREYAAQPGDTESSAFNSKDVARAVTVGITERPRRPEQRYGACGDLAFRHDGAVLGIGHRELKKASGPPVDRLVLDVLRVRRAPPGAQLDPETLIEEWASVLKRYSVRKLHLDGHGFDLAASRFRKRGITCELLPMSLPQQMLRFDALGGRLRAGSVDLLDNDLMKRELVDLRVTMLAGGQLRYEAPRRSAASDDCADVLAALAFEGTRGLGVGDGDLSRELTVLFDGRITVQDRYFEIRRGPGGAVTRLPALPPRGTPAWDRAREARNAQGVYVKEDFEDDARERAMNATNTND